MKNDLINRQMAIDAVNRAVTKEAARWSIRDLPAAQLESKKGKWIEAYDPFNRVSGRCSVCGWEAHLYEDDVIGMNYCPNCGSYNGGKD